MKKFFKAVMILLIVLSFTQCVRISEYRNLQLDYFERITETQAVYFKGMQDKYIHILHTLASIMADYNEIPALNRRDYFDDILLSVMREETDFFVLETIWKPNGIDGLDSRFIGRMGSTSSGQYASAFYRGRGFISHNTSADIDDIMQYLDSDNAGKDRVFDPIIGTTDEGEIYNLHNRITVPVTCRKTKQIVAVVGCYINLDIIQDEAVRMARFNEEFGIINIFSDSGMVLGSSIPSWQGKQINDIDIFGEYLEDAEWAVRNGNDFYLNTYSAILDTNINVFIMPFEIGDSDTTWAVMTAVPEYNFKRRLFF